VYYGYRFFSTPCKWRFLKEVQIMATDGPTPPPCNDKIYNNGEGVCTLSGASNAIENWVKAVAKKANAKVDWHYSG
jgi:hypothetical protein